MKIQVKVVPKDRPNSDGEWLEVELDRVPQSFTDAVILLGPLVPSTHFLVSYSSERRTGP